MVCWSDVLHSENGRLKVYLRQQQDCCTQTETATFQTFDLEDFFIIIIINKNRNMRNQNRLMVALIQPNTVLDIYF